MKIEKSKIIVSICCITYNHAPFIRKALEGFLMQEPPTGVSADEPWYEILIHDDCSTDGTTEIIKEYAAKYPDRIFPLYETENQYSKVGVGRMDLFNYKRVRGRYMAYCEGDDFWTDPHKLQKQVDFMEVHPDHSICFHECEVYESQTGRTYTEPNKSPANMTSGGVNVTSDMFMRREFPAQPLTMLMRTSMYNLKWFDMYPGYRDTHEVYNLLRVGKGYYMDFYGGTYIKHPGGISSAITIEKSCVEARDCYGDLYIHNSDDCYLRNRLISVLLWNYDIYEKRNELNEFHRMMRKYWVKTPLVAINVYRKIIIKRIKKLCNGTH